MSIARRARGKRPNVVELPYRCKACKGIHMMKVDRRSGAPLTHKAPCPKSKPSLFKVEMTRIHANPRRFGL